jgi:hypothetical protein
MAKFKIDVICSMYGDFGGAQAGPKFDVGDHGSSLDTSVRLYNSQHSLLIGFIFF